jgi:hypothetical protein
MTFSHDLSKYTRSTREDIHELLKEVAYYAKDSWIDHLDMWGLELYGTAKTSIVVNEISYDKFIVRSDETAPYLIYHEFGTGLNHVPEPHEQYFPPVKVIERWVVAKGISWTNDKGKPMTTAQMAFLIARKQGQIGLYPKPSAAPAYEAANRMFQSRLAVIIKRENAMNPLGRFLRKLFRM